MKRNCSIEEISDGKLYEGEDLVEASCNGCKGKSTCCHGMGTSIILDPYDIYRLTTNLNKTFEELLADKVELNMVDGAILPNLKMVGETEACAFLMDNGKCSIHEQRPGICRIFPLGRVYENNDFKYFLQVNECQNSSKTLSKISNWIDTPEPEKNKQFLIDWHYLLNDVECIVRSTQDEQLIKQLMMYILNQFYVKSYDKEASFYSQFNERFKKAKEIINTLRTAGRE